MRERGAGGSRCPKKKTSKSTLLISGAVAPDAPAALTHTRATRAAQYTHSHTTPHAMAASASSAPAYLKAFVESVAELPAELRRTFQLMRELDAKAAALQRQADLDARTCLLNGGKAVRWGPGGGWERRASAAVADWWRGMRGEQAAAGEQALPSAAPLAGRALPPRPGRPHPPPPCATSELFGPIPHAPSPNFRPTMRLPPPPRRAASGPPGRPSCRPCGSGWTRT